MRLPKKKAPLVKVEAGVEMPVQSQSALKQQRKPWHLVP
jgi:hypothetical protein